MPEERRYCARLLRRAAEVHDMNVLASEVDVDHVHVYLEIPPQRSVGRAVAILKSLSARYMFKKYPGLKRHFWTNEMCVVRHFG